MIGLVGIVLVSHSRTLAEGVLALARQMAGEKLAIQVAAGAGEDRQTLGTDATEIASAIEGVFSPDGVLVLMDLGSALLSAESALDLIPESMRGKVLLCAAPFVEGAISAAVQASLGADLHSVCREAMAALQPKVAQIEGENATEQSVPAVAEAQETPGPSPAGEELVLELVNRLGLHARPAARFVRTASSFDADIQVRNITLGKGPVSARSLNGVATLQAEGGHKIGIVAKGPQAGEALRALKELVESGFGELGAQPGPMPRVTGGAELPRTGTDQGALSAVPISDGIAVGPAVVYLPQIPVVSEEPAKDPQTEWERLQTALGQAREAIQAQESKAKVTLGEDQAAIFEAHLLILEDPELMARVRDLIFGQMLNAGAAWQRAIRETASAYEQLTDEYFRQRSADVQDVGNQVLRILVGTEASRPLELKEPSILLAEEITPTETAQLDMSKVLGVATVLGGPTSHAAIIARSLGIPAVAGIDPALLRLPEGTVVGLDGFRGLLWVSPEPSLRANLIAQRRTWLDDQDRLLRLSRGQARTKDGRRIEVAANIGGLADAQVAASKGAEGVGLLRTEFLFLGRTTPPTEDEQAEVLRRIGDVLGERPVIVRTLDVGGDKQVPYLNLPVEANPFLGVRAVRLSFQRPELFRTQLRAILRAGYGHRFRIMFPMIATAGEITQARQALEEAHAALQSERVPHAWPIETGIMVEIPSAAMMADRLAPLVDFFSIGTNDLTQYTLAAERGNPQLAGLNDPMHPAVLRLIRQVADGAHRAQKWVGVCGEMAGDPLAVPLLVGLGVDELSLNPAGIPRVKAVLAGIDTSEARGLAKLAVELDDSAAVRELAAGFASEHGLPTAQS